VEAEAAVVAAEGAQVYESVEEDPAARLPSPHPPGRGEELLSLVRAFDGEEASDLGFRETAPRFGPLQDRTQPRASRSVVHLGLGHPRARRMPCRRLDIERDAVEVCEAATRFSDAIASPRRHQKTLEPETDTNPGLRDSPRVIQVVGPHGA